MVAVVVNIDQPGFTDVARNELCSTVHHTPHEYLVALYIPCVHARARSSMEAEDATMSVLLAGPLSFRGLLQLSSQCHGQAA
ncbi:hypothetical protein A0H81_10961 [Grifola frondosa]|uniref:Uncharacterized protein n=1 Tax=Grifola frondosa TaxID=5627 RepID=A0A1C7LX81_GRIFR|nr:hypothetical protein A0H81_10961 [Grifola frondosa]